jgi:hypothetical protein
MKIILPNVQGRSATYRLQGTPLKSQAPKQPFSRIAYAAAHVVANPFAGGDPKGSPAIDWDSTLAFRNYLLGLGFGIAEAMDTSQRGMGLDWKKAQELIKLSLKSAGKQAHRIASGCGTDHLLPEDARSLDDVVRAYLEQLHTIQKMNGRVILMASRALVHVAKSPDDYLKVYSRVLAEADHPVILHWLGNMFDPQLDGYWGSNVFSSAMESCLTMIEQNADHIDGIKISLLDAKKEIAMRRRLPSQVKMYTGDDFNYPQLIKGDKFGFSHALLGIFAAIAPAASAALSALSIDDHATYRRLMAPTVPLSRHIFKAPTQNYKTGIVFLAWLNGHQDHFIMVNGAQSFRSLPYFVDCFKLADQAGLLRKPDMAVKRMNQLLAVYGA